MNFFQAINICFKKYTVLKGRANRAEYWYWRLFEFFLAYISFRLDNIFFGENTSGSFSLFIFFFTFLPGICVSVRRLHDVNKSGWWLLLPFLGMIFFFFTKNTNMSIILSVISFLILLFWFLSPGTRGENRFG
ncbi:MAG: Inner membrane protein YhaI [Alphaproteobacteria bacterium MarineAlpha9_Bin4]|nr:hypothetical protein [Pelagibacterales bacterium]PPR26071.1 MAG: Inner membrane protein YhaI [Alphaproteobacteria bacterium MarineAlpha9_Bin4]|tara:strand:+ start:122 stop:520 length:399 start_codon:yes stop_codon:yes gene_type:complete